VPGSDSCSELGARRRNGDSSMRTAWPRRWWLALPVVLVPTAAVIAVVVRNSGGHSRADADTATRGRTLVQPDRFSRTDCKSGTVIPHEAFELGPRFRGLPRTSESVICTKGLPRAEVSSGTWRPVGYLSVIYGDCNAGEGGCRPPLDVQNWPECARNPRSYEPNPGFRSEPEAEALNPHEPVTLSGTPWIPAQSFEGRTRIEIYAGQTTTVVFATTPKLAREAAETLGKEIALSSPVTDAGRLRALSNQPGNGTKCRTILAK